MIPLFPRKLRLIIADNEGDGIDLGRMSCRFEVVRDYGVRFARAKIEIMNLSLDTFAKLSKKYTRIRLDAGYEQRIGTIFDGEINFAYATKDGADRIVEIFAKTSNSSIDRSTISAEAPGGTDVRTVVDMVAAHMGLRAETENLTSRPIVGRRVMAGDCFSELDRLGKDYSFVWMIDQGLIRLQEVPPKAGGPAILVSRDTGMIGVPTLTFSSIEFTTLLDPRLEPGRIVEVRSLAARPVLSDQEFAQVPGLKFPSLTQNRFSINRLTHIGQTRGQVWYSQVFAFLEGLVS